MFGEGRFIPLLIIDTTKRTDIDDMVKAHEKLPPGDVESQWGRIFKVEINVALILQFHRPSEILVVLDFDIARQGILIEQILNAKALYLQPGRPGDKLKTTLENPRILIEVPDPKFKKKWKKIWHKEMSKAMREKGLNRKDSKIAAETAIREMQKMSDFRMR